MNYFRDYYFYDRIGNQNNIIQENNTNINRNINRNEDIIDTALGRRVYPDNDNWYRTDEGTWREREGVQIIYPPETPTSPR